MKTIFMMKKSKCFYNYKNFSTTKFSSVNPKFLEYEKLVDPSLDLSDEIDDLIGDNSPGIFTIKNVPNIKQLREKVLLSLFHLFKESPNKLQQLKSKEEGAAGYSDKPFYSKNGVVNDKIKSFVARFPKDQIDGTEKNLWPTFKPTFKENYIDLSRLIYNCQFHLLRQFSYYSKKKVPESNLFETFHSTITSVNRSVEYQPLKNYDSNSEHLYNWDDWHIDFSLFTNITHPVYCNQEGKLFDGDTCLFIKDRFERELEVLSKPDDLICFPADAIYIMSGGAIKSTPHVVRNNQNISKDLYRLNFVSFYEPNNSQKMIIPGDMTFEKLLEKDKNNWKLRNGDTFYQGMSFTEYVNPAKIDLKIN